MKPVAKKNLLFGIIVLVVLILVGGMIFLKYFRVRPQSRSSSPFQDGRVLGNAAQQYFLTTGQKSVTFGYNPSTGEITGPLTPWLTTIAKGYTFPDTTIESGNSAAFTMSFGGIFSRRTVTFSDEGKTTSNRNYLPPDGQHSK